MATRGPRTWVTIPDGIVLLSILILVIGVFLAPNLADIQVETTARLFGLSLVLFASAPVVLAGHYNLYGFRKGPRGQVTTQEKWSLIVPVLFLGGYGIAWWLL